MSLKQICSIMTFLYAVVNPQKKTIPQSASAVQRKAIYTKRSLPLHAFIIQKTVQHLITVSCKKKTKHYDRSDTLLTCQKLPVGGDRLQVKTVVAYPYQF